MTFLVRLFTVRIDAKTRNRVLRAIANPTQGIAVGDYIVGCDGCLFVLAAAVAINVSPGVINFEPEGVRDRIALALGITYAEVSEGITLWDRMGDHAREMFRVTIREHLALADPVSEEQLIANTARACDDQLRAMEKLGSTTHFKHFENKSVVSVLA